MAAALAGSAARLPVIVVSWRTVNFDLHLGFPQAPAAFQLSQLRTLSFRR